MVNVEKLTSRESLLENEINEALSGFSAEEMALKNSVNGKNDLKQQTKEKMEEELKSWEIKKRVEGYIQMNGEKIAITDIKIVEPMDAKSGKNLLLFEMEYTVMLDGKTVNGRTYFKIMEGTNNSYFQFVKDPAKEKETSSLEIHEKIYDVNVVKTPSRGIDIRIIENERKTKEKIMEKIKNYELKWDFTAKTFEDEKLENTDIETLQYTQLGNEIITEEDGTYHRAIFIREGEKYREIGKIYFNEKGEVDTKKTLVSQDFKLLWITMNIGVNTTNNTFKLNNIDALKTKIEKHRKELKTYISNTEVGSNKIYTWFNKIGSEWKQTKLLWLKLVDDMYTFKRKWDKEEETINFWFNEADELQIKDASGKDTDPLTIEIQQDGGKKELQDITKDATNKKLLIQKPSKETATNQEKPELKNEPTLLSKDYLYNLNWEKLEYHNKKGDLITSIPVQKTNENLWKLEKLSENVQLDDLYKDLKKNSMEKDHETEWKKINLLDNDIYAAFIALWEKSKIKIEWRETTRVLEKDGIYKYYTVNQKKDGDPLVFEEDTDLYDESQAIMKEILKNVEIIKKIETVTMMDREKNEDFTKSLWWPGLKPIKTADKVEFLKDTDRKKMNLARTFIRWNKTEDNLVQQVDMQFTTKGDKIDITRKPQIEINSKKYKTSLEDQNEELILWFDEK